MSETQRPFEVGDLVVCYLEQQSQIGVIKSINPYFAISPCLVYFDEIGLWVRDSNIKTIRTPRKGGAEARAIVAMLAAMHRNNLKGLLKGWTIGVLEEDHKKAIKDFWVRRKRKDEFVLRCTGYIEYQKAKALLK